MQILSFSFFIFITIRAHYYIVGEKKLKQQQQQQFLFAWMLDYFILHGLSQKNIDNCLQSCMCVTYVTIGVGSKSPKQIFEQLI